MIPCHHDCLSPSPELMHDYSSMFLPPCCLQHALFGELLAHQIFGKLSERRSRICIRSPTASPRLEKRSNHKNIALPKKGAIRYVLVPVSSVVLVLVSSVPLVPVQKLLGKRPKPEQLLPSPRPSRQRIWKWPLPDPRLSSYSHRPALSRDHKRVPTFATSGLWFCVPNKVGAL